jgi:hypothetical protein
VLDRLTVTLLLLRNQTLAVRLFLIVRLRCIDVSLSLVLETHLLTWRRLRLGNLEVNHRLRRLAVVLSTPTSLLRS